MEKKYYNSNIQMHPKVIDDICKDCVHKKMLVWGLGYDTPLWWNVTDNNTYFVESKDNSHLTAKIMRNNGMLKKELDKMIMNFDFEIF